MKNSRHVIFQITTLPKTTFLIVNYMFERPYLGNLKLIPALTYKS